MNVRVALLLMSSALFVRAWKGDTEFQRAQESLREVARPSNPYHPALPREAEKDASRQNTPGTSRTHYVSHNVLRTSSVRSRGRSLPMVLVVRMLQRDRKPVDADQIPMDSLWMFGNCEVPLPAGIAPGVYRAVSSAGEVRKIELGEEELEYHGVTATTAARDLYWVSEGSTRWYFVRVESKPGREWIADDQPDRRDSFQANFATVSGEVLQGALEKIVAAFRGLTGTAGAQTSFRDFPPRGWTRQLWLELRQQWTALLRQVRWKTVGEPNWSDIPQSRPANPSRLSADSVDSGLR